MKPANEAWLIGALLVAALATYHQLLAVIATRSPAFNSLYFSEIGFAILWIPTGLIILAVTLGVTGNLRFWKKPNLFPFQTQDISSRVLSAICVGCGCGITFVFVLSALWNTKIEIFTHFGWSTPVFIIGSAIEEVAFRGYLYSQFRRSYRQRGATAAVILISLLYHFRFDQTITDAMLGLIMDIVFCLIREHCRSLWPPIACHVSYNLIVGTSLSS